MGRLITTREHENFPRLGLCPDREVVFVLLASLLGVKQTKERSAARSFTAPTMPQGVLSLFVGLVHART